MAATRATWLCACLLAAGAAAAAPPADPAGALGVRGGAGFAQALAPRAFEFPQDHGPHGQFRQEWWYFTGHLEGPGGERFGFEVTFFRFALAPTPAGPPPAGQSAWRAREIYMAHFAVTDKAGHRFEFAQKLSRAALGLAGAQAAPLKVWIDDWALQEQPAAGSAPHWRLQASQPDYALELDLEPMYAPVANGDAGLSVKSAQAGNASYYYSLPRIKVRGTLTRGGAALAVSGLAWFDHEWGSGALATSQAGWDWYALQLDDGSALMFYALRDHTGARDPHSAGTYIDRTGASRALRSDEVEVTPTGTWISGDGVRYPSGWRIRVPALALDLSAQPLLADQELRTSPRYWEGAVELKGTHAGAAAGGRGYVELVGYAGTPPRR